MSNHIELVFEVVKAKEGGFTATALGYPIFTEAETWDELRAKVREAVWLHFEDGSERPRLIRLRCV